MLRTKWVSGAASAIAVLLVAASTAVARPLSVEVWTDRGDDAVYSPGEVMRVKARTNDDAYLLVYEIDSEGRITVLFPFRRGAGMVEGKSTLRLPPEDSRYELTVERETGQGYLVAIASREPFRELPWYLRPFDPQGESVGYEDRHDEEEGFDEEGRVLGDPTVAIERIRRGVLGSPASLDDFATSYASYYVGHEVRYPRYLCYDCHRPNRWAWWDGFDPYYTQCSVVDFRVNWNWCWGPCMWSSHTPYYYYVVRHDCPPNYRHWYDRHDRWSSWDSGTGGRRWTELWGGSLTRYKSPPPTGYQAPPTKSGDNPRSTPPGWITTASKGAGSRASVPIGRNRPDYGEDKQAPGGQTWRTPAGTTPAKPGGTPDVGGRKDGGVTPSDRPRGKDQPRFEPPQRTSPNREGPKYAPPRGDAPRREVPSREPPRVERPRREQPRSEQPRYDPPREQPKKETPKQEAPKQDPPKQDPPRRDHGSPGGQKHKGGGGR